MEVRVSWTEYHTNPYREMLPEDPGMRHPLEVLKELKVRGFSTALVSMDERLALLAPLMGD